MPIPVQRKPLPRPANPVTARTPTPKAPLPGIPIGDSVPAANPHVVGRVVPVVPGIERLYFPQRPSTTPSRPSTPPSTPPIRAGVNRELQTKIAPASHVHSTDDLVPTHFHCILFGSEDSRKTTTAAKFVTDPEDARIIVTRRAEQLIPLIGMGYKYVIAQDTEVVKEYLLYPERKFGAEWAKRPEATLILDDLTYFADIETDANQTRTITFAGGEEKEVEVRDFRQVIRSTKGTMFDVICRSVMMKPMHFIAIALDRSWLPNPKEERITPAVPPSVYKMFGADFEFILYIDKANYQLLTSERRIAFSHTNDKGKPETWTRVIAAKHKLPFLLARQQPPILKHEEELDLRAIWERVKAAGAACAKGAR